MCSASSYSTSVSSLKTDKQGLGRSGGRCMSTPPRGHRDIVTLISISDTQTSQNCTSSFVARTSAFLLSLASVFLNTLFFFVLFCSFHFHLHIFESSSYLIFHAHSVSLALARWYCNWELRLLLELPSAFLPAFVSSHISIQHVNSWLSGYRWFAFKSHPQVWSRLVLQTKLSRTPHPHFFF